MGLLTISLLLLQIRSINTFIFLACFSLVLLRIFLVSVFVYFLRSVVCLFVFFFILSMKVLKKTEEILKFEKKTEMAQTSTAIILQSLILRPL